MKGNSTGNLVSVGQIMEDFGCSKKQVGRFVRAGMPKAGYGKYPGNSGQRILRRGG